MKFTNFLSGFGALALILLALGFGIFLGPWLFMLLWNDLTPLFGVSIKLTWWIAFKIMVFLNILRWAWKTEPKVVFKDVKSKLR